MTVIIASTPATPLSGPLSDDTTTSGSAIKIKYSAPDNGGSPITNYEIQMDNGLGGPFYTVAGGESSIYTYTYFQGAAPPQTVSSRLRYLPVYETQSTYTSVNITRGTIYRFRYRAANVNGWSQWSPVASI